MKTEPDKLQYVNTKMLRQIDIVANDEDTIEIEIQKRIGDKNVLYVHVNGITVLRISKITPVNISYKRE